MLCILSSSGSIIDGALHHINYSRVWDFIPNEIVVFIFVSVNSRVEQERYILSCLTNQDIEALMWIITHKQFLGWYSFCPKLSSWEPLLSVESITFSRMPHWHRSFKGSFVWKPPFRDYTLIFISNSGWKIVCKQNGRVSENETTKWNYKFIALHKDWPHPAPCFHLC